MTIEKYSKLRSSGKSLEEVMSQYKLSEATVYTLELGYQCYLNKLSLDKAIDIICNKSKENGKLYAYCEDCGYSAYEDNNYRLMTRGNLLELLSSKGGYIISDKEGGYYGQCPNCEGSNLVLESN